LTSNEESRRDLKAETERIMAVMKEHKTGLLSKPNVVGVAVGFKQNAGISTQELALVVLVETKLPLNALPPDAQIPESIDGIPVDVQEIGKISAQ
jgi:hypothetical protein